MPGSLLGLPPFFSLFVAAVTSRGRLFLKKNGLSHLHTSKNKQWSSERSFGPTASQHWHSPALSVSPQCTHPIQLAGVIGLAGRVSICNLNTVTRPHIFLLSPYFLPHCISSLSLAVFPGNTVLLLTSLQHSSVFFFLFFSFLRGTRRLWRSVSGAGGCEENKLGSVCRLIRRGKGLPVRFSGVEGRGGVCRGWREASVSQRL